MLPNQEKLDLSNTKPTTISEIQSESFIYFSNHQIDVIASQIADTLSKITEIEKLLDQSKNPIEQERLSGSRQDILDKIHDILG